MKREQVRPENIWDKGRCMSGLFLIALSISIAEYAYFLKF